MKYAGIWVKASERLPDSESPDYFIKRRGLGYVATFNKKFGWVFKTNGRISKNPLSYEWLDESIEADAAPDGWEWNDDLAVCFAEMHRFSSGRTSLAQFKTMIGTDWHKALQKTAKELLAECDAAPDGKERFKLPTDEQIVNMALIFNDGKLDAEELTNMVSMCQFVVDRLYENGDITIPSSKEEK